MQDTYKGSSFSFSTVEKVDVNKESKNLSKKNEFMMMMMMFMLKYWKKMLTSLRNTLHFLQ